MQTKDSQEVVARFFVALDNLKAMRSIRGIATFTKAYGINRWNLYRLRGDMSRDGFQTAWLTYLVRDFGVSPMWLLTGEGDMFIQQAATPRG